MKIYLDTWVFQNWVTKKLLNPRELRFLDSLMNSDEHQIILSMMSIWEISARTDQQKALLVAELLDKCSNKLWIRNSNDLKITEIQQAYRLFKGWPIQELESYVESPIHTLEPNMDALKFRLSGRKSIRELIIELWDPTIHKDFNKKYENYISYWAPSNTIIANSFSPKEWEKQIEQRLREWLRTVVVANQLVSAEELKTDAFFDFLITHPNLTMALYFPFHVQYFVQRNSKKFPLSHVGDLQSCSTIEYVDQMVLDKKMYKLATQALQSMTGLKSISANIMSKLNETVEQLANKANYPV